MPKLSTTDPTTLGVVLSQFKTIPAYQRDFVWEESLTSNFVDNLLEASVTENKQKYFTGAMVFMEEKSGSYSIVDGQQRLTVSYLLVLQSIGHLLKHFELEDNHKKHLNKLRENYIAENVRDGKEYLEHLKLKHNDHTIENYLEKLVQNDGVIGLKAPIDSNVTINNIYECAVAVSSSLENHFSVGDKNSITNLLDFIDYVINKVTIIHFVAEDITSALLIYSRLNASGKKLGYLEIIKGLLYAKAEKNEKLWARLESLWIEFAKELNEPEQIAGKGKAVSIIDESTFLAHYFFIKHNKLVRDVCEVPDGFLPSGKFNDFILSHKFDKEVLQNPDTFLRSLTDFAKKIREIRSAKHNDEYCHFRLTDIGLISRTQSQPLLFLLICIDNPTLYKVSIDITSRLVFMFSIYLTGSGTASKVWRGLGNAVLNYKEQGKTIEEIIPLIQSYADGDVGGRWIEFKTISNGLSLDINAQRNKIKSILHMAEISICRLTNVHKNQSLADFYQRKGIDVDHISPLAKNALPDEVINTIGNSALLETNFNRGLADTPFEEKKKRDKYSQSAYFLTKGLVTNGEAGDGAVRKIYEKISTVQVFNKDECSTRAEEIFKILEEYFKIPK